MEVQEKQLDELSGCHENTSWLLSKTEINEIIYIVH